MPMSLGETNRGGSGRKWRAPATPWARILGHRAVWAILVNNFTFHYAFYVVMNWLPTYFDKVGRLAIHRHTIHSIVTHRRVAQGGRLVRVVPL